MKITVVGAAQQHRELVILKWPQGAKGMPGRDTHHCLQPKQQPHRHTCWKDLFVRSLVRAIRKLETWYCVRS